MQPPTHACLQHKAQRVYCGVWVRERGVMVIERHPPSPHCFWRNWPTGPWFTQWKCSGRLCDNEGLVLGEEGRQLGGGRLCWMGAVIWRTQAGTGAPTDGRWAERLRGDSYSTLRMAAKEQHEGDRRDHIYLRWLYAQVINLSSMILKVLHIRPALAHTHTDDTSFSIV